MVQVPDSAVGETRVLSLPAASIAQGHKKEKKTLLLFNGGDEVHQLVCEQILCKRNDQGSAWGSPAQDAQCRNAGRSSARETIEVL